MIRWKKYSYFLSDVVAKVLKENNNNFSAENAQRIIEENWVDIIKDTFNIKSSLKKKY